MKEAVLLLFVVLCAWQDLSSFRIPNALILAGAAAGIAVRVLQEGCGCMTNMAAGALIPAAVCALLFYFSMLGAADVKMFMVIGIIAGGGEILKIMWYALLAAAVGAVFRIWKYHLGFLRAAYFLEFIRKTAAGEKKEAYIRREEIENEESWLMHLAVPIAAGCILWLLLRCI